MWLLPELGVFLSWCILAPYHMRTPDSVLQLTPSRRPMWCEQAPDLTRTAAELQVVRRLNNLFSMSIRSLCFVLLLFCVSACTNYWEGPKYVTASSGQCVCAMHRVPLVRTTAYFVDHKTYHVNLTASYQAAASFPNALIEPTQPVSPYFTERRGATYCPKCQENYHRRITQ